MQGTDDDWNRNLFAAAPHETVYSLLGTRLSTAYVVVLLTSPLKDSIINQLFRQDPYIPPTPSDLLPSFSLPNHSHSHSFTVV